MDFGFFFKILGRRKWLLLAVFLTLALLTFFLVSLKPRTYRAYSIVSTGIITYKGVSIQEDNPFVQEFQIENSFNNRIELMLSRASLRLLTYKLLLHDFDSSNKPFRSPKKGGAIYTKEQLEKFRFQISNALDTINGGTLGQNSDLMIQNVSKSYGYDFEALRNALLVKRKGETDYLEISFASESPQLSAFVTNHFVDEFMRYWYSLQVSEDKGSVKFYKDLVVRKKRELDTLQDRLTNYKVNRNISDLDEQSKITVTQIKELEVQRANSLQEKESKGSAVRKLDDYYKTDDSEKNDSEIERILSNKDLDVLRNRLSESENLLAAKQYKDQKLADQVKALRQEYTEKIKQSAKNIPNRTRDDKTDIRDDIKKKKIDADVDLILANERIKTIDRALGQLKNRASSLTSFESFVANLEKEIDIAKDEYKKVSEKLNEAIRIEMSAINPMQVIERAQVPEHPESNKAALLSGFAGFAGLSFSILLLFLLAYFDNTLNSPFQFRKIIPMDLIASVVKLNGKNPDPELQFSGTINQESSEMFKTALRKLRYDVEASAGKTIMIASNKVGQGKTFIIRALAKSLQLNGKRVLIIDCNFKNNELSVKALKPSKFGLLIHSLLHEHGLDKVFKGSSIPEHDFGVNETLDSFLDEVDHIGCNKSDSSPSELFNLNDFKEFITEMGTHYDVILIECAALSFFADGRELIPLVDKVVMVFSSDSVLKQPGKDAIDYIKSYPGKLLGGILNKVEKQNLG
jgi:polysaccharide biosynthesis transport protein